VQPLSGVSSRSGSRLLETRRAGLAKVHGWADGSAGRAEVHAWALLHDEGLRDLGHLLDSCLDDIELARAAGLAPLVELHLLLQEVLDAAELGEESELGLLVHNEGRKHLAGLVTLVLLDQVADDLQWAHNARWV
jgi:hypothetical protein